MGARRRLRCPYCGERLETFVTPDGGERQEYVEDCAVCCRPIKFLAVWNHEAGEHEVEVFVEG